MLAMLPVAALAQTNLPNADVAATPVQPETVKARATSAAEHADSQAVSSDVTQVVITGVATHGGRKKLDTSYSETSLSQDQIDQANANTFADALRASPGVYVESSGGPTGVNLEVAGFPGTGAPANASFQLNGVPIFPTSFQTNLEPTAMFRLDDTLQRLEIVQGGPTVLYGTGAPALTVNYILKRGTDRPSGDVGVTYYSEGAERIDGFLSGPISKTNGLYGTIGGYWSTSDNGVRKPNFTAEGGGQLTASLEKRWDSGSLLVYGRYLKYDAQFVTDTPLVNTSPGKFSVYPGFSPLTGTLESKADQYVNLQVSPCTGAGCTPGTIPINMADGRGPNMLSLGAEYNWNFGNGLQVVDDLGYTQGTVGMDALYSTSSTTAGQNPETLSAYIANQEKADKLTGITGVNAYYTSTGAAAPLTQNVLTDELRYLREGFRSVSNEIHLSYDVFPGNTVTVGNYTALYSIHELEFTGSDILLQAQNDPSPIGINLTNGTSTWQLASSQGFVTAPSKAITLNANGFKAAFFIADTWKVGSWLFDAGVRDEHETFRDFFGNTAKGSLSGDKFELYNSTAQYLVPGSTAVPYNRTGVSWTVGANYEFNPHMSAYIRVNNGVHLAAFSEVSTGTPHIPLQKSYNFEAGYKYKNDFLYADVGAFSRTFTGIPASGSFTVNGTAQTLSWIYGSKTEGIQYQVVLTPFESFSPTLQGFSLSASGDYAHMVYANDSGCETATDINNVTTTVCNPALNADGMLLARQPIFQTRVTPAYALPTSWGSVKAWATVEYVGEHYGDMYEQQYLGNYTDWSFGLMGDVGKNWVWSVRGTNVGNQIGLTEGNARDKGASITAANVILARSIAGREINAQLKYKF